jgi:hypothetical protein
MWDVTKEFYSKPVEPKHLTEGFNVIINLIEKHTYFDSIEERKKALEELEYINRDMDETDDSNVKDRVCFGCSDHYIVGNKGVIFFLYGEQYSFCKNCYKAIMAWEKLQQKSP